jgi:hypothetical protein
MPAVLSRWTDTPSIWSERIIRNDEQINHDIDAVRGVDARRAERRPVAKKACSHR